MKEESCWKVKQNTSCRASGTHLDSCPPLPPKIPEHKNKSKLIAGVVKNSVSSPVLTTLITPVRMKNLRDVTEGEKLKMSHVEDQEPWQSLSPESSYHLHCSHDEKVLQPSAEKRASRHVWRRLPLWALCKDCALKAGLASERRGISKLAVSAFWMVEAFPAAMAFAKQLRIAQRAVSVADRREL